MLYLENKDMETDQKTTIERPRLSREDIYELNKERLGPYLIRLVVILPLTGFLHYLLYLLYTDPVAILSSLGPLGTGIAGFMPWIIGIPVIITLGFIMSGLMVLAHEMSHGHLIRFTPLNLVIGTAMAVPLAVPYPFYGLAHKRHHTYNTTKADPSYFNSDSVIIKILGTLLHYTQLTFFMAFISIGNQILSGDTRGVRPGFFRVLLGLALYSSVIALFVFLNTEVWIWHYALPWLSFQFWNTTRAIGEHEYLYDGEDGHKRQHVTTRSFRMSPFTAFFWWNAGYHIEHHLYPSIPFHNLPEAARRMHYNEKERFSYFQYLVYRMKRGSEFPMFF